MLYRTSLGPQVRLAAAAAAAAAAAVFTAEVLAAASIATPAALTSQGEELFCPRLLVVDVPESLGGMRAAGNLYVPAGTTTAAQALSAAPQYVACLAT